MRIALAACVAALVAVGILVAGCAGGTADGTARVLRSVSVDLGAPPAADASAAIRGTTGTGEVDGCYYKAYGRKNSSNVYWEPSFGFEAIAHDLWVAGSGNVWIGNDAYAYYKEGTSVPSSSGATTWAEGLVYFVFLRNETSGKMLEPWVELNGIAEPPPAEEESVSGKAALWSFDSDHDVVAPGPQGGLCTLATWPDLDMGEGVPGDTQFDRAAANADETYDTDTMSDCDAAAYERPLFFDHLGASSTIVSDADDFGASVTIYWYEQP